MATLTLSYKTKYSTTTVEKTFDDDSSFDELYESLREACMALGFSPETVKEYFDWGELGLIYLLRGSHDLLTQGKK